MTFVEHAPCGPGCLCDHAALAAAQRELREARELLRDFADKNHRKNHRKHFKAGVMRAGCDFGHCVIVRKFLARTDHPCDGTDSTHQHGTGPTDVAKAFRTEKP